MTTPLRYRLLIADGKKGRPLTLQQLQDMADRGTIKPVTPLEEVETGNQLTAGQIPGLKFDLGPISPEPLYCVLDNGGKGPPCTLQQLQDMANAGKIKPITPLEHVQTGKRGTAGQIPGLKFPPLYCRILDNGEKGSPYTQEQLQELADERAIKPGDVMEQVETGKRLTAMELGLIFPPPPPLWDCHYCILDNGGKGYPLTVQQLQSLAGKGIVKSGTLLEQVETGNQVTAGEILDFDEPPPPPPTTPVGVKYPLPGGPPIYSETPYLLWLFDFKFDDIRYPNFKLSFIKSNYVFGVIIAILLGIVTSLISWFQLKAIWSKLNATMVMVDGPSIPQQWVILLWLFFAVILWFGIFRMIFWLRLRAEEKIIKLDQLVASANAAIIYVKQNGKRRR